MPSHIGLGPRCSLGRDERNRTSNLMLPKHALCQIELHPGCGHEDSNLIVGRVMSPPCKPFHSPAVLGVGIEPTTRSSSGYRSTN